MLTRLYKWYGKSVVRGFLALIVILAIAGLFLSRDGDVEISTEPVLKTVRVAPVASLSGEASLVLVGAVESKSQADIQTESAGRIVSVPVKLGQRVAAGQVIATLENANERAAVLQAEGSYEAALAAAAQSDVSTRDAETSLQTTKDAGINTYRSAFTTVDDIIRNLVDELFKNPDAGSIGFRLKASGEAVSLNGERVAYRTILLTWASDVQTLSSASDSVVLLREAETQVLRTIAFVDRIAVIIADEDNKNFANIDTYKTRFLSARSNLNATLSAITAAQSNIKNAEEALERAEIAGTNADMSAANAAVKQALGALRNVQATLAKTVVRTPIAGTLNELSIKAGDFVGMNTPVALVANNDALEITTFVGDNDREQISVGQAVTIERDISGVVTTIAPAVNQLTRKVEVKIGTESTALANGDTVTINIVGQKDVSNDDAKITVPITAIKFSDVNGVVFTVEDSVLVAHEVELGSIFGSMVEVVSGIEMTDEIVTDARGLSSGQRVESIQ